MRTRNDIQKAFSLYADLLNEQFKRSGENDVTDLAYKDWALNVLAERILQDQLHGDDDPEAVIQNFVREMCRYELIAVGKSDIRHARSFQIAKDTAYDILLMTENPSE